MPLHDWLVRESLRRRLAVLAVALSELSADFEVVRSVSSETVSDRLEQAVNDYWRAVKAFEKDCFVEARQSIAAAFLEVEFVRSLMAVETVERELGEGDLFELSIPLDSKQASARIQSDLKQITVELFNVLETARKTLSKG